MQRIFKILIPAAIVLLLVILGMWWHSHRRSQVSFRTTALKRGDVETTINASGTIEPMEVVDVGAQVAGRIKSFGTDIDGKTVDYGSVMEEGAVLAKIDDSVYAADFAVANAQVEQASAGESSAAANLGQMKAKLIQSEAEWKRAESLYASKLMAQADYDAANANYQVAKSDVSVAEAGVAQAKATAVQAQAGMEKAQRNLDFCTIQSPVKGVIIDRRVNIGQTVVASLNAPSLFLIAKDLTKMQIWVSVNEADVGRIKIGAPASFTCSAFPGRRFVGKVGQVRLNATMTQNIVIYTVVVNTENPDNVLLPYLTANVDFVVRKETNALIVPNAALRWSPSSLAQIAPDIRAKIQNDPPGDSNSANPAKGETRGVVWSKEGDYARPIGVKVSATDGVNTAILSDTLKEGAQIITGAVAGGAETTGSNPFLPSAVRW
jgi:HlyD family secretion protein